MSWLGRSITRHFSLLLVGAISIGGLVGLRIADPFVVREARQVGFDLLQRTEPRAYQDVPIKIVDIDEKSLGKLGQWPWPRDILAELVDRLQAAGAAAVAFDFLFVEPDRMSFRAPGTESRPQWAGKGGQSGSAPAFQDNDAKFADAVRRGNVILGFGTSAQRTDLPPVKAGFAFTGEDPALYVTRLPGGAGLLPILASAANGIGSVNLRKDSSATAVRRIQLLWSDGKRLYPSLVSEALRVAQGASTYLVNTDPEIGGVQSVRIGAFDVPTGPHGELFLYYTKPREDRYVSAADLFDDKRLQELAPELAGRIVFIGTSAPGLFDQHRTALGYTVPGVEMHAQAAEQIITGQFLVRKDWTRTAEVMTLVAACLMIGATTIFGGAWMALLIGTGISSFILFAAWYAFRNLGILVDFTFPLGGGMTLWFIATAFRYVVTDREKRGIRNAFSHYVHPSVLKQIERNFSSLELGGENSELTVMFTDVRNFTPLSERLEPAELVSFLNRLLGRLSEEIAQEAGVIDKYIGDSVMAFWNAPLRQADHAHRACAAALAMRAAVREMTANKSFGLPDRLAHDAKIEIGVGLNTGIACVGNVGSSERFNYSAIGDAVNISARAESACKELGYDLVVCRTTADQAGDFAFLEAGSVGLKGKTDRVPITILVGDAAMRQSPQFKEFVEQYRKLVAALVGRDWLALEGVLAQCQRSAANLDPKLLDFLERLPARRDDFAEAPSASLASVAAD